MYSWAKIDIDLVLNSKQFKSTAQQKSLNKMCLGFQNQFIRTIPNL
jgi:hypothetical protein